MIHAEDLSHELDRVIAQASATTIALAAIGVEMRAVLTEERHDPGLTATVLDAHAKRAALAITTLSSAIGQIALLARFGALALAVLLSVGCSGAESSDGEGCAGAAPMPALVDRACVAGEQGNVTGYGLSLTGEGCTEVVNRSGITGARSWCCPIGAIAYDSPDAGVQ